MIGALVLVAVLIGVGIAVGGGDDSGKPTDALPGLTPPKGYTPTFAPKHCREELTTEAPEATCGDLIVPQDREHPNRGPKVRVDVVRVPARAGASGAAPTLDFGADAIGTSPARDHSDLIEFGNRGWFRSSPELRCPELSAVLPASLSTRESDPAMLDREITAIRSCRARWISRGFDPRHFNVYEAALDTLDLMTALKIPRVDLVVRHQLSTLAFAMLRRAPGAIRSLTIQSPMPNGSTGFSNAVADLSAAFGRYVAQCNASAPCREDYPDLESDYVRGHATYTASPKLIEAPNADTSRPPVPLLLDGDRIAQALTSALTNTSTYTLIPAAITTAAESVIASQALEYNAGTLDPANTWGAALSYICSYDLETIDPNGTALAAETAPAFSTGELAGFKRWCQAWDVPRVPDSVFAAASSPVPALFYRGALSPVGDVSWIQSVARSFPNSSSIVFPTLGDDFADSAPPCFTDLRRQFLANPTANLKTAACAAQSPEIQFVAPTQ